MQKEWEKPDHKQRSYDNKDFHLRWSSSFFRRKIRHWLGVAFSSHNSKQFMSTFIFFLSSGKYNFFSYKKGQLWSTCSRCNICTSPHYWCVARTSTCIFILFPGKRTSCSLSCVTFWNKTFYRMNQHLKGYQSLCTTCTGRGGQKTFRSLTLNISICHYRFGSRVAFAFSQSHWRAGRSHNGRHLLRRMAQSHAQADKLAVDTVHSVHLYKLYGKMPGEPREWIHQLLPCSVKTALRKWFLCYRGGTQAKKKAQHLPEK